jgi:hypothetical protein
LREGLTMLTCPMCKKKLRGMERECPNCRTDVSLLIDYVENLREGLTQAEAHTRAGQLGDAVWAYLTVLEIDPDNTTARRQVGKVATAVRQFDQTAPGRVWFKRLKKQKRFQRWMANVNGDGESWLNSLLWFLLVFIALVIGYYIGKYGMDFGKAPEPASQSLKNDQPEKNAHEAGK